MQIHVFRFDIYESPGSGAHALSQELGAALHRSVNRQFDGARYDLGYRNVIGGGETFLRLLGDGWACRAGIYLLDQFSRSLGGFITMRMFFEDINPLSADQSLEDVVCPDDGFGFGGYVTLAGRDLTLMVYIESAPMESGSDDDYAEFDPWPFAFHMNKGEMVAEGCHYALVDI